jgi:hypothetical protein
LGNYVDHFWHRAFSAKPSIVSSQSSVVEEVWGILLRQGFGGRVGHPP